MEGRVCVLLHKQVPGTDLVDHDHLHSDAIREHELQRRGAVSTAATLLMSGMSTEAPGEVSELAHL